MQAIYPEMTQTKESWLHGQTKVAFNCQQDLSAHYDTVMLAVASRVIRALELTFTQPTLLESLVKNYGVCVEEVCIMLCQW